MHAPDPLVTRRDAVGRIAAAGSATLLATAVGPAAAAPRTDSPVAVENARPGTRDWLLTNVVTDRQQKQRSPSIEGYCSRTSVRAGDRLSIFVSTRPASRFTIQIYRMGYYGGDGGRLVADLGEFAGKEQPEPPVGAKRLRRCEWEAATELEIPANWPSGVYVGKLTSSAEGRQSYVIFIVRDDRAADFLFQCSDFTWQAYNRWPHHFALYDDGRSEWYWGGGVLVDFDRPYGKYFHLVDQPLSTGSGEWFLWEFPLAYWLESQGYDLTYVSNLDTHRDAAGLRRCRGFLSVGHDEYWSIEMFRNVQAAIAAGVSVGFFSGNAVFGRIELDDRQRAFERVGVYGPPQGTQEFVSISTLPHERPYGNELIGAHSTGDVVGHYPWICTRPDHWVYAGTGMRQGEQIPGVIGWEFHGDPAPIPGLEVVASGPPGAGRNAYTATVYPGPHGNVVFNAATCFWADGVAAPPGYRRHKTLSGPDPRLQQITRNVLEKMLSVPRPPVER